VAADPGDRWEATVSGDRITKGGRGRLLATALFAVAILFTVLFVVEIPVGLDVPRGGAPGLVLTIGFILLALVFATAGLMLTRRLARNPVGWSFLAVGVLFVVGITLERHAQLWFRGGIDVPGATAAAWLSDVMFNSPAIFAPFLLFFLFFPTGYLPSRRWRPVLIVGLVAGAILFVDFAFRADELSTAPVENPLGIEALKPVRSMLQFAFIPLALALLASVGSLVVRFRRATGIERQQIKWFLTAAAIFASVVALAPVLFWQPYLPTWVWPIVLLVSLLLIPTSAAVAIFKYRLYEIDVIINRALVYAVLTAVLAGAYIGSVFALRTLLAPFTADSDLAIAASTLAVAALFRPVRLRVQDFIDHRFYRRKFDAQRTLEDFSEHLRDEVDLGVLSLRLTEVVADTMQPSHVSLWIRGSA
jgi:uncharacterized membrane protein YhaH (DUF805 family)